MKYFICLLAISTTVQCLPTTSAHAREVTVCGDNLRECISKSNIEWRRTHDDDELVESHNMCNIEYVICTFTSFF
jgi:hypothetical protein